MSAPYPTILATCGGLIPGGGSGAGRWGDAVYGPLLFEAIRLASVPDDRRPRVLHINTAGGDQRSVEGTELEAARLAGVDASHLRFFPRRNVESIEDAVFAADVVWVSGGSLVALLAVWRAHGLDSVLQNAWRRGVVLAGGSAGAICWHAGGTTQSFGPDPVAWPDGLSLLPGSLSVHSDSDPRRSPVYRAAVASGALASGIEIDEGVGLVYRDTTLVDVVADRTHATATHVCAHGARKLPVRVLPHAGADGTTSEGVSTSALDPFDPSDTTPPEERR